VGAAEVRFERGEKKRSALEEALRQGLTVGDALELVQMSNSTYNWYRGKYPEWRGRWEAAKLRGRSVRAEDPVPEDERIVGRDGSGRLIHVPATFTDLYLNTIAHLSLS
jgi:hypothetical protein